MKLPLFTLEETKDNTFFYAEYPHKMEHGSFLQIRETADSIAIKVDRFSTIPFYYIVFEKKLYGSTKFSLLLEKIPKSFKKELNIEAAIDFLRTNTLIADKTFIVGIKRISFGHELSFNKISGEYQEKAYWKLPGDVSGESKENIIAKLECSLLDTIKLETKHCERIGIHLSGGMDSRNIMGALLNMDIPFSTYTYGVNQNLDVIVAKELSKKLALKSTFIEWDGVKGFKDNANLHFELTDGMHSLIHGHGIEVHELEASEVDTVLYGHFLDFYMQGHMYNKAFEGGRTEQTNELLYQLFNGGPCSILNGDHIEYKMFESPYHGMFRSSIEYEVKKLDYMIPEKQYDAVYFIHHGLRRLLPQVQAGAQFLDFRLPGLKQEYFDLAWTTPGMFRKGRSFQEELLRRLHSGMMELPIVKDNKKLSYMGGNKTKRFMHQMKNRVQDSRFKFLLNEYDYYGKSMQDMANAQLFEFIKKEVLSAKLEEFGFLKKEYLDDLFKVDRFRTGLSLYSTFYTLSKFINTYKLQP
jgi:asparagine synthase (glutamine-hydrolysing)